MEETTRSEAAATPVWASRSDPVRPCKIDFSTATWLFSVFVREVAHA